MTSHDYHEDLPGYDPAQILHDGCEECEARSREPHRGITNLDSGRFIRAWHRARTWYTEDLPNLSYAEEPLLSALSAVQIQLGRVCDLPLGSLPDVAGLAGTGIQDAYRPIQEACALILQDMRQVADGPTTSRMHVELAATISALAGIVAAIDRNITEDLADAIGEYLRDRYPVPEVVRGVGAERPGQDKPTEAPRS